MKIEIEFLNKFFVSAQRVADIFARMYSEKHESTRIVVHKNIFCAYMYRVFNDRYYLTYTSFPVESAFMTDEELCKFLCEKVINYRFATSRNKDYDVDFDVNSDNEKNNFLNISNNLTQEDHLPYDFNIFLSEEQKNRW